jgi:hypothetical protein
MWSNSKKAMLRLSHGQLHQWLLASVMLEDRIIHHKWLDQTNQIFIHFAEPNHGKDNTKLPLLRELSIQKETAATLRLAQAYPQAWEDGRRAPISEYQRRELTGGGNGRRRRIGRGDQSRPRQPGRGSPPPPPTRQRDAEVGGSGEREGDGLSLSPQCAQRRCSVAAGRGFPLCQARIGWARSCEFPCNAMRMRI